MRNLPMNPETDSLKETHEHARKRLANELRYLIQQVNAKIVELTDEHEATVVLHVQNAPAGANTVVNRTFGYTEVSYTPKTKVY